MTAAMLDREYGVRSPWFGIGGYAAATLVAVTRQLNNRHWMSDVLVGAGIGVLSTEAAYLLADLIFRERGSAATPMYMRCAIGSRILRSARSVSALRRLPGVMPVLRSDA